MSESTTFVSCELANPMPKPKSIHAGSNSQNVRSGLITNATTIRPTHLERETELHDARHADPASE